MGRLLPFLLLLAWPLEAAAQAISQGRSASGLPWAVVEVPGGESEVVACWLPPHASVPEGFREARAVWGKTAVLQAPALSGLSSLTAALEALPSAVAVVLVGPMPARELSAALEALAKVPATPAPTGPCPFLDGELMVERSRLEGFQLAFPAPPPTDPRWELGELVARVAERRWQQLGFSGPVRWQEGTCPLLVFTDYSDHPRQRLARARQQRSQLSASVSAEELEALRSMREREASRWAVDPEGMAAALVERVGWGRNLGPVLYPPAPSAQAVETLLGELMSSWAGSAVLWEREQRALLPETETLPNGVTVRVQPIPAQVAIVALALSGVAASVASETVQKVALSAAKAGLPSETWVLAGMAAVAMVVPPAELAEQLEEMVTTLLQEPSGGDGVKAQAWDAAGLATRVHGENVAVVLRLPEGGEEGLEAARKFLASVPMGPLRQRRPLAAGLHLLGSEGRVEVVALAPLPPTSLGAAAGELLRQRLAELGAEAQLHHQAGQLLLSFATAGQPTVTEAERQLEKAWDQARLIAPEELLSAFGTWRQHLFGSAGKAAMRQGMGVFFPELSGQLPSPEDKEVAEVLAALPGIRQLARLAQGPPSGKPGR